MITFKLKGAP